MELNDVSDLPGFSTVRSEGRQRQLLQAKQDETGSNAASSANTDVETIKAIVNTLAPVDGSFGDKCQHIDDHQDVCGYVRENCNTSGSLIPYLYLHYCVWHSIGYIGLAISLFLMSIVLVFLFYLLGKIAEDFFVPTLARISELLKLSQNVAGVTFLAFGNGAPDVFSSLAAIITSSSGIAFGALLGAGVFVTTVVIGAVVLARPAQVNRRPFLRDTLFYIVAVFAFTLISWDGEVYVFESAGFFSIYIIYVVVVIGARVIYQRRKSKYLKETGVVQISQEQLLAVAEEDDQFATTLAVFVTMDSNTNERFQSLMRADSQKDIIRSSGAPSEAPRAARPSSLGESDIHMPTTTLEDEDLDSSDGDAQDGSHGMNDDGELLGMGDEEGEDVKDTVWSDAFHRFDEFASWSDMSIAARVLFIGTFPLIVVLKSTIPAVQPDEWNRFFAVVVPTFSALFLLIAWHHSLGQFVELILPVMFLGFLFSVVVLLTTRTETHPTGVLQVAMVSYSFMMNIAWIYVVANELVALLLSFGIIFDIAPALLGLTVLAWGNSLGDLISDVTVARKGLAGMAIGACIGGPLFNLVVGAGMSITLHNILYFPAPFCSSLTPFLPLITVFLLISLFSTLISVPLNDFKILRVHGVYLIVLYGIFLSLSIGLFVLTVLFNPPWGEFTGPQLLYRATGFKIATTCNVYSG
jgi:solute carrier family 24 (sodium/potassium/calcium exchanger), member 6